MKKLLFYIVLLLLASCGGENEEIELIPIDELIGETGEVGLDTINDLIDTNKLSNSILDQFIDSQVKAYDTVSHDEFHWMDRFGYSNYNKVKFIGKEDVPYGRTNMVTPKANLFYYTFSDSTTTNNAFYNWLDCFGSDCNVVNLREDMDAIKTPPMFTVVYDTTILVIEYLCEHEQNDWNSFQDSLLNKFGNNHKFIIDVECGGPLRWK